MPRVSTPESVLAGLTIGANDCWHINARITESGYAYLDMDKRTYRAHRFIYELLVGPIPAGLVLDHLCRVKHCVNPDHLEPVTHRENVLRGVGPTALNARRTHCPKGHALTDDNLVGSRMRKGVRLCKTCWEVYSKNYQHERSHARRTTTAQ